MQRANQHKTPAGILKKEQEVFELARDLFQRHICSPEFLQIVCQEIAGVSQAKNLRYTSQQKLERVIQALKETEHFLRKDIP